MWSLKASVGAMLLSPSCSTDIFTGLSQPRDHKKSHGERWRAMVIRLQPLRPYGSNLNPPKHRLSNCPFTAGNKESFGLGNVGAFAERKAVGTVQQIAINSLFVCVVLAVVDHRCAVAKRKLAGRKWKEKQEQEQHQGNENVSHMTTGHRQHNPDSHEEGTDNVIQDRIGKAHTT